MSEPTLHILNINYENCSCQLYCSVDRSQNTPISLTSFEEGLLLTIFASELRELRLQNKRCLLVLETTRYPIFILFLDLDYEFGEDDTSMDAAFNNYDITTEIPFVITDIVNCTPIVKMLKF